MKHEAELLRQFLKPHDGQVVPIKSTDGTILMASITLAGNNFNLTGARSEANGGFNGNLGNNDAGYGVAIQVDGKIVGRRR